MGYQKIPNLLDNTTNLHLKQKTSVKYMMIPVELIKQMVKSSSKPKWLKCLCNYSEWYILVKRAMTIAGTADRKDKQLLFQNCEPFFNCMHKRSK